MTSKVPKIKNISWGKIEIEDQGFFKDVKLFPAGCRSWDWQETGTQHSPGIQYSDVKELIDNHATDIILSKGMLGRLLVPDDLVKQLESEGIKVHVRKTKKAAKLYNELVQTRKVGALIHTTC